jgi:adenine phosphoribosyltransferase
MRSYLRKIDTGAKGGRYDVTPLFADVGAFESLVADLADLHRDAGPDVVVCVDALGFVLGTAIARELRVGVVPVRKGGKLPVESQRETFIDYSGEEKALELRHDALSANQKVLLVDDWIETGSQIRAAICLVESMGAAVVGIAAIHIDQNPDTRAIEQKYRVRVATSDSNL